MSNLVNLVKALLGSIFDFRSFEAKNRVVECNHRIDEHIWGVFTCSILASIVIILISIVVILTSIEPILEKSVHLQVQNLRVLSNYF